MINFGSNSSYGLYHWILVICSIILIIVGLIIFRKKEFKDVLNTALIIGIISETLKVGSYIIANEETYGGYLPKTDLPFQLCSLQILFIIFLKLSKNENAKRIILCFMIPTCLVGGIAAIFIPTSSSLNMPVVSIQYFIYHSTIIWLSLFVLIHHVIDFNLKDYRNTLLFLVAMGFIAVYLNSIVNDGSNKVNFMYVVKPPADNLPFLTIKYGWGVYIAHYACLAFMLVTAFYVKPIIQYFKNKKLNKTEYE